MLRLSVLLSCFFVFALSPSAGNAKSLKAFQNGISHIDLDADEHREIIVKADRENNNAHSYHVLSFYKKTAAERLAVIPVEKPDDSGYTDMLSTQQGADCTIRDYALIKGNGNSAPRLIRARRSLDEGYAAQARVTFTIYTLGKNKKEIAGMPNHYFAVKARKKSKQRYCDVGSALEDYVK